MESNENKPLSAYSYKHKGRFNIMSNEQQWQVVLRASTGTIVSEIFDDGAEPDIDGLPPSEVLELISAKLESYWISTDREKTREKINWFRENAEAIDAGWARREIAGHHETIERLKRYLPADEAVSA